MLCKEVSHPDERDKGTVIMGKEYSEIRQGISGNLRRESLVILVRRLTDEEV